MKRREKLVTEILKHSKLIGSNESTLIIVLMYMTDVELKKFHKEFCSQIAN